jgi:hypothetical protein
MSNITFAMVDDNGNEEYIVRVFRQDVIPRIGETIWLHTYIDPITHESEGNTRVLYNKYGTTKFKVVDVCHWISNGSDLRDCSVYVVVVPIIFPKG